MYNKYYRLNESRWELPEESEIFTLPDYSYYKDKDKHIHISKNLEKGWDKDIIEELTHFYYNLKDNIVTENDELDCGYFYSYIDFSHLTSEEETWRDRTDEVREVIRKNPNLNPSDILFKESRNVKYYDIEKMCQNISKKLSCTIKVYTLIFNQDIVRKTIFINGFLYNVNIN